MAQFKKHFPGQYSNEKVLFVSKGSIFWFIFSQFKNIFILLIFIGIVLWICISIEYFFTGIIISAIVLLIYVFYIGTCYKNTKLYITSRRILKFSRDGIFDVATRELQLRNIKQTVTGKNSLLESCFNYGDITIHGYDDVENIHFYALPYHQEVGLYISRIINYIHSKKKSEDLVPFKTRKERYKYKDSST